jgi:hypothetical protein
MCQAVDKAEKVQNGIGRSRCSEAFASFLGYLYEKIETAVSNSF